MKYRSLFAVLISIGIVFSLLSCMKRKPIRIYDTSRVASADAARITIPSDIKVESVDGQRVKSVVDYVLSTINEIHVAPGEREIIVRYSTFWLHDNKKSEEIKSKDITLNFHAERGGLYTLAHPELDDMSEAKKFAENPDIWIAKVGKFFDRENEGPRVSHSSEMSESKRYTEPEKPPIMEIDTEIKEEWYSLSEEEKEEVRKWLEWKRIRKEKEEFRKWLEWKKISEEEKEEFRKWLEWKNTRE
ncbi:MAG: DUF2057 family protein [Deltaproteobacteria bacterium]|nr:DUF2057 family protein [Deltaproteobacteria bacterium]